MGKRVVGTWLDTTDRSKTRRIAFQITSQISILSLALHWAWTNGENESSPSSHFVTSDVVTSYCHDWTSQCTTVQSIAVLPNCLSNINQGQLFGVCHHSYRSRLLVTDKKIETCSCSDNPQARAPGQHLGAWRLCTNSQPQAGPCAALR